MLHKNDEAYTPKPAQFERYKPNATFRLVNRLIKSNPNKKNRRKSVPRSFSIEPFYNVTARSGEQAYFRYFKAQTPKTVNGVSFVDFQPVEIAFEQDAELRVMKDKELWWFLFNHPRQINSPFRDEAKPPMFYLEDKAQEADDKAKISRLRAKALEMIWSNLKKEEVKVILKGYGQPNVDELSENQIKGMLEQRIKSPKGLDDFIERTGGASMTIRAQVQDAIDLKIIVYDDKGRSWNYTKPDGTASSMLCPAPNPITKMEDLAVFLRERDKNDNLTYIISAIEAAKKLLSEDESSDSRGSLEGLTSCEHCEYVAKSAFGLQTHTRMKHPDAVKSNKTSDSEPAPAVA